MELLRPLKALSSTLQIVVAVILLQTLFFKFRRTKIGNPARAAFFRDGQERRSSRSSTLPPSAGTRTVNPAVESWRAAAGRAASLDVGAGRILTCTRTVS